MKIEPETRQQLVRNAFLSLFIYLLPIALMFLSFAITGERPWDKKAAKKEVTKSINTKNTLNNGSND